MKLKRITAALLAGVMCVGLLAGCGSKGDGDEKGSGDKITIRLLTRMAGTTAQVDIYNDILDEFKEKHPEVTIVDDSQGDESAFNNILSTDIASGTMANIFRIQGVANLSEYIDNGLILDVQPYLDEDPEWGGCNLTVWVFLVLGFVIGFAGAMSAEGLEKVISLIPAWLNTGLSVAGAMLPAIGFAMILNVMAKKELIPFVLLGYCAIAYFKLPNCLTISTKAFTANV